MIAHVPPHTFSSLEFAAAKGNIISSTKINKTSYDTSQDAFPQDLQNKAKACKGSKAEQTNSTMDSTSNKQHNQIQC
ncbi:hypothetical protein MRB53_037969 [Persea americana]|nr:hypothetical protein MRB53_037969 [Persea americana]